jgi:hypothetical protein
MRGSSGSLSKIVTLQAMQVGTFQNLLPLLSVTAGALARMACYQVGSAPLYVDDDMFTSLSSVPFRP